MPFTSKLGTSSSRLGGLQLGKGPTTNYITVTSTLSLTNIVNYELTYANQVFITDTLALTQSIDYDQAGTVCSTNYTFNDLLIFTNFLSYSTGHPTASTITQGLLLSDNIHAEIQHCGIVYNRTVNSTLNLTQNISATTGDIYSYSLSDTLSLSSYINRTGVLVTSQILFTDSINYVIGAEQSYSLSTSLSFNDTINYTLKAIFSESLTDTLTLTETTTKVKLFTGWIYDTLTFSQTLPYSRVYNKKLKDKFTPTSVTNNNRIYTRFFADELLFNNSYPRYLNYNRILNIPTLVYAKTTKKANLYLQYQGYTLTLPLPQFEDAQALVGKINVNRTMTGGVFTYVHKPVTQKLRYRFSLSESKLSELLTFLSLSDAEPINLLNWKNENWFGYVLNEAFEITEHRSWDQEITLEFEGIKL